MPFQGNPNAGAPDPALINMLFQQKQRREEMQWEREKYQIEAQRQAQLDAADQARKDRESRLKATGMLFDIQAKMRAETEVLGQSQEAASDQIGAAEKQFPISGGSPVMGPSGAPALEFGALTGQDMQNMDTRRGVAEQAMMPVYAQQAAMAQSLQDIPELQFLQQTIPEQGMGAEARRERKASLAEGVKIADERRGEERGFRERADSARIAENKALLEDNLRDANVISDVTAKALGGLDAVSTLQQSRNELKKTSARLKAAGEDTSDIDEKIGVIGGQISSIKNPSTIRNVSPIPFESKQKLVQDFRGADFAISTVERLYDAFESGSIQSGLTGKIVNLRAVSSNLLSEALGNDAEFANSEVGQMLQNATAKDGSIDLPTQLTLGLEEIALAYVYSRMGRGNARFTIKEMQAITKQLGLTSLTATPDSIKGALIQVADAAVREKTTSYFLLGDDPEFRDQLSLLDNLPADQALLNRMKGVRQSGPPGVKSGKSRKGGAQGPAPLIDPRSLRQDELLQLFPE